MAIVIGVVVALIIISILIYISIRNGIIGARNRCDEAWSGIDVQLKRRHDLVPNLVETVKGYASHEKEVFEKATKARAEAMQARTVADNSNKEAALPGALTDRRAVAENYPPLRPAEKLHQLSN